MANEIATEITLDLVKLRKQLDKAKTAGAKAGKRAGKKFGDNFEKRFDGLGRSLKRRFLALGVTLATAIGGRAAIAAAARQEDAVNKLNAALRASGQFSEETSRNLQDFAANLERVTTTGDETVLELQALGLAFGFTSKNINVATQAALELAAAADINVVEAMRRVGRTISGSVADVSKFAKGINSLTKEQLAAGEAANLLASNLAGSAAAQTKTFSGRISQLSNAFGTLLENLGELIIKSPTVLNLIIELTTAFNNLAEVVKKFGEGKDVFKPFADAFIEAQIRSLRAVELVNFGGIFGDIKGRIDGLIESLNKIPEPLKKIPEPANEVAKVIKGITFQDVADNFDSAANQMKITAQSLGKVLQSTFIGGFSSALSSFGGALAKGENAFEAFGKSILKALGQLLITFGQMLIAIGVGLSTVPFLFGLQGPAAVAAGVAATVLGGALLALAGGGGAPVAAAGGGIAATGGGGLEVPAQDLGQVIPDTEQQDLTKVTVNVQGNILDRRETGLEIAEIINEAFNSDGVIIAQAGA